MKYAMAGAVAVKLLGCGSEPVNDIEEVVATQEATPEDPQNGDGIITEDTCTYDSSQLPLEIFKSIPFDPNASDLEQMISNQRVPEGGLTLGQLFDAALTGATAYSAEGFKLRCDNNSDVRTALYNDLNTIITETTCKTAEAEKQEVFDSLMGQIFGTVAGTTQFVLRDTNSVYFSRADGNDGIERTYLVILGETVPAEGDQPGVPVVLYHTPVDESTTLLESIEQGGI